MITLRYSAVDTFLRCRRAYYYQEVKNIEAKELPQSLWVGKLCAELLSVLHSKKEEHPNHKVSRIIDNLMADYQDSNPGENRRLQSLCILSAMIDKYSQLEACKVLKGLAEYKWEVPMTKTYTVAGTVDLFDKGGKRVYEFKYTTSPDNYNEYTMADQVALYMWGTKSHKATARLFSKPNIRATQLDPTRDFLKRCTAYYNKRGVSVYKDLTFYQSDFQDYQETLLTRMKIIAGEILSAGKDIAKYYQTTKVQCLSPFVCQYLPICKAEGKISKYAFVTRASRG
mgnify:CR=1 FL=1